MMKTKCYCSIVRLGLMSWAIVALFGLLWPV